MYNKKRGYYFKKKEQKRDGHALRCKKYARFVDAEAGTFWGLPLDKPWFICSFYKGGEVMSVSDEFIKKYIDDVSSDSREVLIKKLHDYIRELVLLNDVVIAIDNTCEQEIDDSEEARQLHNTGTAVEDIIERLSSSATALYRKGRTDMAEEILNLVKKKDEGVDEDNLPERKY
jgi:hypothetical protein|tara:strand:- start:651 stop:1172 length:522 start_codon:yes stop_codon:yes gene_type:complete